jgi:hypothetical protein
MSVAKNRMAFAIAISESAVLIVVGISKKVHHRLGATLGGAFLVGLMGNLICAA